MSKQFNLPSVEEQREELRNRTIEASEFYRILHIGRYAFGKTDIVSRMKQALENLGHTVFDFNTDDFRGVVYNPDRLTGGIGPVEIKLDQLKPILKEFKPQIIICNAGGYTFSEEDSNWLKDLGFILVGITLSDPDVFVGTKKFAHRFDYHATNAIEALNMYKEAGINNTIHFPFAIDRSFIETEAVARPDWNADVVCIGNAFNREDRNRVMNHLNQSLDVKVYGTGWEIPGAFPVSGEDFFSAARAGKFHINFPATRAGYTNLKIGVFESIANGGILCTEIFEEMEIFFDYGEEIIGYKNEFDLKEKIEYYLAHPEEAENIRRKSFAKLVEKHMWESRWEDLFAYIRQDINQTQSLLNMERYSQIGKLIGQKQKAAKVIIQGYYGALNSGDDLILESISHHIKAQHPNTLIMVAGFNPQAITLKQGFYSLPRTDYYRMDRFIKEADLLIYGGGGLLNDYSFNQSAGVPDFFDSITNGIAGMGILPTIANIHEVPKMYFALGVGPLTNPEARKFAKFLANQMDLITVRDQHSKQLLESIPGVQKEIHQTSDPTYMLQYPGTQLAQEYIKQHHLKDNLILVSLRDWRDSPEFFEQNIATYLDSVLSESNTSTILFLPYQFGRGKSDDNNIHERVSMLMSKHEDTHIYKHNGKYDEFLSLIGYAQAAISMRLHGSILANRFGVPAIGFNYDEKVMAHYQNMKMEPYLLELDFKLNDATTKYRELIDNRRELVSKLNEAVKQETAKSAKTFDMAVQLLKQGINRHKEIYRFYPRQESLRNMKTNLVRKELLEANLKKGEIENELYNVSLENKLLRNLDRSHAIASEMVDLNNANVYCQNQHLNKEVTMKQQSQEIVFRLSNIKAPKKKDYTIVEITLDVIKKKENMVSFVLHNSYQKPRNKGRIQYSVILEGKKIHKEDIALSNKENFFNLKLTPKKNQITLRIKLEAMKNCESWSWGSASRTKFYGLRIWTESANENDYSIITQTLKRI